VQAHARANLVRSRVMETFPELHDVMVHVCPTGDEIHDKASAHSDSKGHSHRDEAHDHVSSKGHSH
jgi:porphobilinogen deaminase